MLITSLRKVGGSVMLAVPPAVLDLLDLKIGCPVSISVKQDYLVIKPVNRPYYSLDELLRQCQEPDKKTEPETVWPEVKTLEVELL